MNRNATKTEFSRLEVITSEFLLALRESGVPNAYRARNLVLDYYATERAFIRLFQIKVDARLASPTAQWWDLAVNADHVFSYRYMSTQVIKHFDDNWTTYNRLLATRIMQSLGKWKRLSPDPTWEARIIEHFALTSTGTNPSTIPETQDLDSRLTKPGYIPRNRSAAASRPSPKQAKSNQPTPVRHTSPQNAPAVWWLAIRQLLLVAVLVPMALPVILDSISIQPSRQQVDQESFEANPRDMKIDKNFQELQSRLGQYKSELVNARLVCELDAVAGRMKSLATDARKINFVSIAKDTEQILSQVLKRIARIKQPGKQQYWESCAEGVGYQSYDKYEWMAGGDFKGKFFAVAKKDCINPAIGFNVYADKGLTKKLHSQWVKFTPNVEEGIADNVIFTVPSSSLPQSEGSYVWWAYDVKCNYEG